MSLAEYSMLQELKRELIAVKARLDALEAKKPGRPPTTERKVA